jgi:hypothetical protein
MFGMLRPVEEPRSPSISLAGAGSVLLGFTGACMVAGALLGWAVGNWPVGLAIGVVVGIPVGVAMVVWRYRKAI